MYESFFNLSTKPFDLLPNPEFLFMSKSHKRALAYLDYGIRERAGFILLTGEVGSGKTTVIRNLIRKNLRNVMLSKIFNTRVDSSQLIAMINDDFGLPVTDRDKITLLRELNEFLIEQYVNGNQAVLIIDEAQNLGADLLEEIRMLSNLETDSAKLLQIILVGQPELRQTLAAPSMVQLRQRISINCHIQPLTRQETEEYILHRLDKAGSREAATFSASSFDIIYTYSRGIPRLINIICDFLLLSAFAEETNKIEAELVKDIIGDLNFETHFWGGEPETGPCTHQGSGSRAATVEECNGLTSMITDISSRIENLARETEEFNRKVADEMTAKISALEQSFKSHRKETGQIITDLRSNLAVAGNAAPFETPDRNLRGNFLKRMFRV